LLSVCERSCIRSTSFYPVIPTFTTRGDLSQTASEGFSPPPIGSTLSRNSRPSVLTLPLKRAVYTPGFPSMASRMSCEYTPSRVPLAASNPIRSVERAHVFREGWGRFHIFPILSIPLPASPAARLGSGADSRTSLGSDRLGGVLAIRIGNLSGDQRSRSDENEAMIGVFAASPRYCGAIRVRDFGAAKTANSQ
jgi:hypothetical protein